MRTAAIDLEDIERVKKKKTENPNHDQCLTLAGVQLF